MRLLFTRLEQRGICRLRVAPTLAQGAEEIAVRPPHYVFVENGISGLPGPAIAGYLRGVLPEGSEVILMARNAADTAECREVGGLLLLELAENDEALQRSITGIIPQYAPIPRPLPCEPPPSLPGTAREYLSRNPDHGGDAAIGKRLLWLIPLALALITLGVVAYRASTKAPRAAQQNAGTVRPGGEGAGAGIGSAPDRAAPQRTGKLAAGESSSPPGEVSPPSRISYVVQPGEGLLRILVKKFGFTVR